MPTLIWQELVVEELEATRMTGIASLEGREKSAEDVEEELMGQMVQLQVVQIATGVTRQEAQEAALSLPPQWLSASSASPPTYPWPLST